MIPVSWRNIKTWNCTECGMCCRDYHVVLNFNEWVSIVRKYGVDATIPGVRKLLLGKNGDGTCNFLKCMESSGFCGLQNMKPLACKIWPFKVLNHPKFGNPNLAFYKYRNRIFYIYVDPACTGLSWGKPTTDFKFKTLPEFIDVAMRLRRKQFYSTSKIPFRPIHPQFRGRTLI